MKNEESATQAEPTVQPSVEPKPVAPVQKTVAGSATVVSPSVITGSRPAPILGGISIKAAQTKVAPVQHIEVEVKPLTEEDLAAYWKEAAETLGLQELLAEGAPHLGEKSGIIEIDAQSVTFHDDFKPHKIDVMEFLRGKTGMKMLDCKVNQLFVSKEEVTYSPDDKYKAMVEKNPHLAELRKLFPNIDY